MAQQASHTHSDTEMNHKSHANKPQTRCESKTTEPDSLSDFPKINSIAPLSDVATGNLQLKTNKPQTRCESKTTEPDSLIDFPEINSIAPLSDVATGNLQLKTQHTDKEMCDRKIKHNSRRYSIHSLHVYV